MKRDEVILVRGGGDLATGTIHRLGAAGLFGGHPPPPGTFLRCPGPKDFFSRKMIFAGPHKNRRPFLPTPPKCKISQNSCCIAHEKAV